MDQKGETPSFLSSFLQEYKDLFKDLVDLPSYQAVEHQIDLLRGKPLPNMPHYRTKAQEAKEIHNEV